MVKNLFIVLTIVLSLTLASNGMACFPNCSDNVTSNVAGHVSAYDFDSLNRDAGSRGANAFADGWAAGEYNANAQGNEFAHTSGGGEGFVNPQVGAIGGANFVAVGAMSKANSRTGALAMSDGGLRDASASTYGSVYQNNSAWLSKGFMTGAAGGNESGASYYDSDSESYDGTTIFAGFDKDRELVRSKYGKYDSKGNYVGYKRGTHKWVTTYTPIFRTFCFPGIETARSSGQAFTAGGTVVHSIQGRDFAKSFGATGNVAVGNGNVWGNGQMETGAFVSNGHTEAGAFSAGSFNYSGNGFGAGVTFGKSNVNISDGYASSSASHTSIATGSNGRQVD